MNNLIPLVERWRGPVSIALHAPGTDFETTIKSIFFMRNCLDNPLIKDFITFHLYFDKTFIPAYIPKDPHMLERSYECPPVAPYLNKSSKDLFKIKHNLTYPINVGRNLAKKAALTYFVLVSDVELYPSPGLIDQFFKMVVKNVSLIERDEKWVLDVILYFPN